MREQVSKRVVRGLAAEVSGKYRRLPTELGAEVCPFAVVHNRPIEVKHSLLDEPEGNDSGDRLRDRGDVVRGFGSSRNMVFDVSVAQAQCESDRLTLHNGYGQSRDVGSLPEGIKAFDEGGNIL